MQLTDEDHAAIDAAALTGGMWEDLAKAYRTGLRAGMERAAKIIESSTVEWGRNSGSYIAVIRASAEE